MTRSRFTATLLALSGTAALVAGCGSSGSDSGSSSSDSGKTIVAGDTSGIKKGGTLTANDAAFPDYLDPALAYTADGWDSLWSAYTPLLTYKHASGEEGAKVVPGLAEDMPTISADGLTYKLKLRSGLLYSDGSTVKASDFKHTIQRVLNLESGGASFYEGIVGAKAYEKAGKSSGDIPGIVTDDATGEITIKLEAKDPQFTYKLAMDFAGLVPGDTPFQNETKNPPPAAGAYMVTKVTTGQGWSLVRNPHFKALPNVPEAYADEIDFTVVKNARRSATDIVNNNLDYQYDPNGPDTLQILRTGAKGRYLEKQSNSVYYEFLNTKLPPFNNLQARQAVNYAIDKRAIARLFGGLLTPTCNFLPPGVVGFKKLDPCPYGDPNAAPNLQKAIDLVKQSGTAGQAVTVWGDDKEPSPQVTNYFADVLDKIGYKAKVKVIDAGDYFSTVGNATTKSQIGFADWFQDFPHPADFLFLVDSKSIQPTNNQNFSNVDDPKLDAMIAKANAANDPAESADQYAAIDKYIADNGYEASYGNRINPGAFSSRIAVDKIVYHPVYDYDPTTIGLKAGQ
ncbi:MAG: ABC transporter substrate-binding protein [Solirubrobacteraceae bacterium]|nr:ABC transporter substrate-binding protein [Patulibacter sp.]